MGVCPHTENGICNGLGSCNYCDEGQGVCTCSGDGVYKEDDGLCYPKCEDNCNHPQGYCKYGSASAIRCWAFPGLAVCAVSRVALINTHQIPKKATTGTQWEVAAAPSLCLGLISHTAPTKRRTWTNSVVPRRESKALAARSQKMT